MSGKNNTYPHLLPLDIDLWERFLKANTNRFLAYEYDVRVGFGRDPGAETASNIRQMSIDLSQRRIDAIGHTDADLTIIEITVSAGLRAIGQILAYPILFSTRNPTTLPVKILVVANEIQTDMEIVYNRLGIPFELYPE